MKLDAVFNTTCTKVSEFPRLFCVVWCRFLWFYFFLHFLQFSFYVSADIYYRMKWSGLVKKWRCKSCHLGPSPFDVTVKQNPNVFTMHLVSEEYRSCIVSARLGKCGILQLANRRPRSWPQRRGKRETKSLHVLHDFYRP